MPLLRSWRNSGDDGVAMNISLRPHGREGLKRPITALHESPGVVGPIVSFCDFEARLLTPPLQALSFPSSTSSFLSRFASDRGFISAVQEQPYTRGRSIVAGRRDGYATTPK